MTWEIAKQARDYADRCPPVISNYGTANRSRGYGENFASSGADVVSLVSQWYAELGAYRANRTVNGRNAWAEPKSGDPTPLFDPRFEHFFALVWRQSTKMGCAKNDDCGVCLCRYNGQPGQAQMTGSALRDNVQPTIEDVNGRTQQGRAANWRYPRSGSTSGTATGARHRAIS